MNTQIIILAAGHGKRMQSELPKALTPLLGKPFIQYVLDAISQSGVCNDPIIVIGQKGDQVRSTLGEGYKYAIQEEQLGTGHAVMIAEHMTERKDTVLVLYADHAARDAGVCMGQASRHSLDHARPS
jgi:bifunctional UDP-N-acetylglucosamine pyrophosphorylase/glucosamine-1-phosphate N-acetyltransferase